MVLNVARSSGHVLFDLAHVLIQSAQNSWRQQSIEARSWAKSSRHTQQVSSDWLAEVDDEEIDSECCRVLSMIRGKLIKKYDTQRASKN